MTGRALVLRGDARTLPLPDASVDLVVTSPPFYALRSYTDGGETYAGQIGSEATPQEYIAALIDCTREWMRVLKPSGSCWVDLGDKYAQNVERSRNGYDGGLSSGPVLPAPVYTARRDNGGVRTKSLLLLPERYRIACVDQLGLIARAVVVWSKPNGSPESVTDRVRRSHEDWVHLVKQPRYFSAVDEIRETYAPGTATRYAAGYNPRKIDSARPSVNTKLGGQTYSENPLGKLPGSVWKIASEPLTIPDRISHERCCGGAKRAGCQDGLDHFAAFPTEWPRRIILGWSPSGICVECGEGRKPVVASVGLNMDRPQARRAHELAERAGLTEAHFSALLSVGVSDTGRGAATQSGTGKNTPEVYVLAAEARRVLGGYAREYLLRRPTGYRQACACPEPTAQTRPSVVLDPFGGTGTTALVARALGRTGITVDRSADYCRLAQWRTTDRGELAKVLRVAKPPRQVSGQLDLFGEVA